jgi:hypothetical protein
MIKGSHHSKDFKIKLALAYLGRSQWNKGIPCREETKQKISIANKGKIPWITGKKHTKEALEKMRLAHLGKSNPKTSETLKRLFAEGKRIPINKGKHIGISLEKLNSRTIGFYGHHTTEVKLKISKAHKGTHPTKETIIRMSLAKLGNKARLGTHHSEETRKKMSIGISNYYKTHRSPIYGKILSEERRKEISAIVTEWHRNHPSPMLGKKLSEEAIKQLKDNWYKNHANMIGRKQTREEIEKRTKTLRPKWKNRINNLEYRKKLSDSHLGKKNPMYIDGSSLKDNYRARFENYYEWRIIMTKIKKRDNNTCRRCGKKNVRLSIHHIIPFRICKSNENIDLITVCDSCHTYLDHSYRRLGLTHFTRKYIEENMKLEKEQQIKQDIIENIRLQKIT